MSVGAAGRVGAIYTQQHHRQQDGADQHGHGRHHDQRVVDVAVRHTVAQRHPAGGVGVVLQTQLESLVVHGDEAAPHAHFMLRGYCDDGQPVSKRATYRVTRQMQDIAAEVIQQYCPDIERGHTKWDRLENGADHAETINRSVKQLHEDLPKEIAVKQAELQILVDEMVALTASIDKTRRHFDAMEARRDKTAKQMKTARTAATMATT